VTSSGHSVSSSTEAALTKSFASAADLASSYPPSVQSQIVDGAKTAFLQGDQWAYTAGIAAVLLGATLVALFFPRAAEERHLLAGYHGEDAASGPDEPGGVPVTAA
jgi:hypothetical protein